MWEYVRLLVTKYVEQWSFGAVDSHLLHQETPCLITEKADLVLSLHKPVTCHSSESSPQPSVLFLWKGKFVPVCHEGICGKWSYHCIHFQLGTRWG